VPEQPASDAGADTRVDIDLLADAVADVPELLAMETGRKTDTIRIGALALALGATIRPRDEEVNPLTGVVRQLAKPAKFAEGGVWGDGGTWDSVDRVVKGSRRRWKRVKSGTPWKLLAKICYIFLITNDLHFTNLRSVVSCLVKSKDSILSLPLTEIEVDESISPRKERDLSPIDQ
jgi:hypothetical protein